MPITAGSLSCRCFRVSGKPGADFRDAFALEVQRHKFRPPQIDKGEFRSLGWVNPRRILETEFDLDDAIFGQRMILALRIDKISLNSRIYKARLFDELSKIRRKSGRDRLTRDEQRAVEEKLQIEMAKRQTPSTSVHEMAWNMKSGLVIYTAASDSATLEFQEIFSETFGLSVEPRLPYLKAEQFAEAQGLQRELLESAPAVFSARFTSDFSSSPPSPPSNPEKVEPEVPQLIAAESE